MNDPAKIVFDPSLISTLAVGSVRTAKNNPDYLLTGIPQMDDHYVMLRPPRVTGVLADTSHGKTSIMNILARNAIPQLKENEVAVWATWEDSIEDFGLNYIANVSRIPIGSLFNGDLTVPQWNDMMQAATARAKSPLWAIGHSETHSARRPRLTMSDIWAALEYIEDRQKKHVKILFLDYLQRINRADTGEKNTREGFVAIMDKVKDIGFAFNTIPVIGSQIGRDIDQRKWKQPQVHDAQETSNFEQTCDGIISLWLPKRTEKMGECLIQPSGMTKGVYVNESLMMMQTLKQKKGRAPVLRSVSFYPSINEIGEYRREQT